ncbi:hypothetical protein BJ170DRAFT_596437 [Xylariales sp. AK1849]|nr:hypothetical protein BJ170DRAFT_596437 [Xylariales sp. AK1849]
MSSTQGTFLLLGGNGKVARHIASLLWPANIPSPIASRPGATPAGFTSINLDWLDKATWAPALCAGTTTVFSVWIVAPGLPDPGPVAAESIDLARGEGARSSLISCDVLVHQSREQDLLGHARREYPLGSREGHCSSGKLCFDDAGAAKPGFWFWGMIRILMRITNKLANIFTKVLGRQIIHHDLKQTEAKQRHQSFGTPKEYANVVAAIDKSVKNRAQNRLNDVVLATTGRKSQDSREFVQVMTGGSGSRDGLFI